MFIHTTSVRLRALITSSFLTGFALVSSVAQAQTNAGKPAIGEDPAVLRVIVRPTLQPNMIKVCVENSSRDLTHVVLRNEQGQIIHEQNESSGKFTLPLDMAPAPAGLYTIEVSTMHARHTETFRLEAPTSARVVMNTKPANTPKPALPISVEVTAKQ